MNKLKEDLRVGVLGAVAALFSISVTLLVARVDAYHSYQALREESNYEYVKRIEDLWWIPGSIWHVLLAVVAAFLVHRYLANRLRSPFLLWVVTGTASLLGWGLTLVLIVSLDCLMRGDLDHLVRLVTSTPVDKMIMVAKYVSTAFASSVLYASVMKASARQYADSISIDD